jgi:hypothetical protein
MESLSYEKSMKELAGITLAVERSWLKLFGQGSTGSPHSTTPETSSSTAKRASYSPPSLMHPRQSCIPSLLLGPSHNGASIK